MRRIEQANKFELVLIMKALRLAVPRAELGRRRSGLLSADVRYWGKVDIVMHCEMSAYDPKRTSSYKELIPWRAPSYFRHRSTRVSAGAGSACETPGHF